MGEDWTREEVEAAVADYLIMLSKELKAEPYNKAEHNRRLCQLIKNRSPGSIEFKHQNISAVLLELGYPYVSGYKPRRNYQSVLMDVVSERLSESTVLGQLLGAVVDAPSVLKPTLSDLLAIQVETPAAPEKAKRAMDDPGSGRPSVARKINYLERESRNRVLGLAGEKLVLEFEHERLWRAGKKHLAEQIDHVSESQGDGLGYDIRSFEESGRDRLIEVKTTQFGSLTPFFVSTNEVAVSDERADFYHLYRVYGYPKEPHLFVVGGALAATLDLQATMFRATLR